MRSEQLETICWDNLLRQSCFVEIAKFIFSKQQTFVVNDISGPIRGYILRVRESYIDFYINNCGSQYILHALDINRYQCDILQSPGRRAHWGAILAARVFGEYQGGLRFIICKSPKIKFAKLHTQSYKRQFHNSTTAERETTSGELRRTTCLKNYASTSADYLRHWRSLGKAVGRLEISPGSRR